MDISYLLGMLALGLWETLSRSWAEALIGLIGVLGLVAIVRRPRASLAFARRYWFGVLAGVLIVSVAYAVHTGFVKEKWEEWTMVPCETKRFYWELSVSSYNLDSGRIKVESLERDNWFKDAQGHDVLRWDGVGGQWGVGIEPIGGRARKSRLPKTFHFCYYDYQEDRFYQLDAELPLQKLYDLFQQKTVSSYGRVYLYGPANKYGEIVQRYDGLTIGIAPEGHVMVWVTGDVDQVELAHYRAKVMEGMTVERYNREQKPDPPLWKGWGRWGLLERTIQPETVAKLKDGWLPDANYYMRASRVKYPWRIQLSGNASRLTDFQSYLGNAEMETVYRWEMADYENTPKLRGVPEAVILYFHDKAGQRHKVHLEFHKNKRVAGEPDLSEVFAAFAKVFPTRTVDFNVCLPEEEDMAVVDIQIGDDAQTATAALVSGNRRIPLPTPYVDFQDLKPLAEDDRKLDAPPTSTQLKLLEKGPSAAGFFSW